MRKLIVAAGLALALTAASRQEASAWTRFNLSAGVNLNYESTGSCFQWGGITCLPNPSPYGCAPGFCAAPAVPAYGAPFYGYSPVTPPVPPVAPAVAAPAARTQQVGYYFYSQGYAPSYWYGN
jgi:hypothetical protein